MAEPKRKPKKYEILFYAHYNIIDTWAELVRLNKLFQNY